MVIDVKVLKVTDISIDGVNHKNVKVEFPSGEIREVTVKGAVEVGTVRAAVQSYWGYHKAELAGKANSPLAGQTISVDVVE